jgi:hypothetical protein
LLFEVNETPTITTSLPAVCPNERYSAKLEATGAGPDSVWTTTLPASTGLAVIGDRLEGTFVRDDTTEIPVHVSVDAAGCSASATLSLATPPATATVCPRILPVSREPNLPAPCRGAAYDTELIVTGGSGPYVWEATSLPEQLDFDPATQVISGVSTTAGTLTVRVEDGAGRIIERSDVLEPRDACWLAYQSSQAGLSLLHLFDPVLGTRHSRPEQSEHVLDFEFSPDGHFLAYRIGATASASRIRVVEMLSLAEEELALTGVGRYAWSADSSVLAVAFETEQGRYLGGADVANAERDPGSGAPIHFPLLDATAAAIDSPLVWYAGTQLAFLSPGADPVSSLSTTSLGATGFVEPTLREPIVWPDTRLMGGAAGFFAMTPLEDIWFHPSDGSVAIPHSSSSAELRAISPSGRYLGNAIEDEFELFPATSSTVDPSDPPADTAVGCSAILSWAEGRERVACASDTEVMVFDVDATTNQLTSPEPIRGNYDYPTGAHTQRQRGFSPSGDRFVFTNDDSLYIAILNDGTPRIDHEVQLALTEYQNLFTELAFAPNERALAFHRGSWLEVRVWDDDGVATLMLSGALPLSERCEEDFTGRQGTHCGGTSVPAAFGWSADSDWIAYRNAAGDLHVYDLSYRLVGGRGDIAVTEPCTGDDCPAISDFMFQPSAPITITR